MSEFDRLLEDLERQAAKTLKMDPFGGKRGGTTCPWLRFWGRAGTDYHSSSVEGILMMQDWGTAKDDEDLSDGMRGSGTLYSCFVEGRSDMEMDTTIRRIREVDTLAQAIQEGRWVVSNATWGLRKKKAKVGFLGNTTHKASFPIWSEVVRYFAAKKTDFKVVFAGDWARFAQSDIRDSELGYYLGRWKQWVDWKKNRRAVSEFEDIPKCARSFFCHHPSTWPPGGTSPGRLHELWKPNGDSSGSTRAQGRKAA